MNLRCTILETDNLNIKTQYIDAIKDMNKTVSDKMDSVILSKPRVYFAVGFSVIGSACGANVTSIWGMIAKIISGVPPLTAKLVSYFSLMIS